MKFLKCKLCLGEVDLVGNDHGVNRKSKCRKCGFTFGGGGSDKGPEVIVIRKQSTFGGKFE